MKRSWVSETAARTAEIGGELATTLAPRGVILLSGALGTGKTVLVQGLATGLGLDPLEVQSPSYTLLREHGEPPRLIHIDLYRVEPEDTASLGLDEVLEGPGVKAIEWPERLPFSIHDVLCCEIRIQEDGARAIRCEGPMRGPMATSLIDSESKQRKDKA